jgi:RNA polymerase sigma-54 factor
MQLRQKMELRHLMAPQLRQSLKILALPLLELKSMIEDELSNNPFLEESQPGKEQPGKKATLKSLDELARSSLPFRERGDFTRGSGTSLNTPNLEPQLALLTRKSSLQDVLLRQLGMLTGSDEELRIGQEIIGNIDDNGYLMATTDEIAKSLNITVETVENALGLIQQCEPPGVAARSVSECLLIQLELAGEDDPLLKKIVESHLEDIAKKNYSLIAKALNQPQEKIEPLIKKILRLNPKPGRNYSTEETQRVIPDIIVDDKGDDLKITISSEDIPDLNINKEYRDMLKNQDIDPQAREFLNQKLHSAMELLRAISKRQATLRRVVETVIGIQQEAIKEDLSHLKPLTFKEVAQSLNVHESTICRVVMNKYVKTPYGVIALKDLFTSHIHDTNGQAVSSSRVKGLIKEFISQEDKKHPLSDQKMSQMFKEKSLNVPRRTVAKYREELRILSTPYRRER